LFDFGDASAHNELRSRTNIAPQALFMMNSEFIAERSLGLAKRLLEESTESDARRLERAYLLAYARPPSPDELDDLLSYIGALERRAPAEDAKLRAWQSVCQILMASNEFNYVD
jgi:hypothetical protein